MTEERKTWEVHDGGMDNYTICEVHEDGTCQPLFEHCGPAGDFASGEWIIQAHAAYEVMMRRGWWAEPRFEKPRRWVVWSNDGMVLRTALTGYDDPFTALVEADEWYRENVENAVPG